MAFEFEQKSSQFRQISFEFLENLKKSLGVRTNIETGINEADSKNVQIDVTIEILNMDSSEDKNATRVLKINKRYDFNIISEINEDEVSEENMNEIHKVATDETLNDVNNILYSAYGFRIPFIDNDED